MVTEERQSKTYWNNNLCLPVVKRKAFSAITMNGKRTEFVFFEKLLKQSITNIFLCSLLSLCPALLKWRLCQTECRAIHSEWGTLTHDESIGSSLSLFCSGWRSSALLRVVPGRESQRTWPGISRRSWWSAECLLSKCGREFACKHQIS